MRDAGPAYTPDGAAATDATVAASEKLAAADGLVRGEEVRHAAADALIRTAGTDDAQDSGSQLPAEVTEDARGMARVWKRTKARFARNANATTTSVDGKGTATTDGADGGIDGPPRRTPSAAGTDPSRDVGPMHVGTRTDARVVTRKGSGSGGGHAGSGGASGRAKRMARDARAGRARRPAKGVTGRPARRGSATSRLLSRHSVASHAGTGASSLAAGSAHATAVAGGSSAAASASGAAVAAPVIAIVVAVVVILLLAATVLVGGAVDEDQRAGAHRLAQTATDEYLEGEARGDYNHKGAKYSAYVRGPNGGRRDWDVCLVSWCMARAGFEGVGLTGRYSDVGSYLARFRYHVELGEVYDWNGPRYVPVEGDLFVVPYTDGTSHIGIVTSCDGTWFQTVEGDVVGGPDGHYDRDEEDGCGGYVASRERRLGQYSYTFIHPYYSEEAVTGR